MNVLIPTEKVSETRGGSRTPNVAAILAAIYGRYFGTLRGKTKHRGSMQRR
jgi:hypothetical protein